jgi:hypothetical protein
VVGTPYEAGWVLVIGAAEDVWVDLPDGPAPRFRGRITDLASRNIGDEWVTSVTCAGRSTDIANATTEAAFGQTLHQDAWSDRWELISDELPPELRPWVAPMRWSPTDPYAEMKLRALEPEQRTCLDLFRQVAVARRSVLVEGPDGILRSTPRVRRFTGTQIHCAAIIDDRQWSETVGSIINSVTVKGWNLEGNPREWTEQAITRRDQQSIARHGLHHQDIDTEIDEGVVAGQISNWLGPYAVDVLRDWKVPRWAVPQILVDGDAERTDHPDSWAQLMRIQPWDTVMVDMTAGAPVPTDRQRLFWVCGWVETWSGTDGGARQDIQLSLARDFSANELVLVIVGPDAPPVRGAAWPLRVMLLNADSGQAPGLVAVHAVIAGDNTEGEFVYPDLDTGIAVIQVPPVDADNVTVNVITSDESADTSARYTLVTAARWSDEPPSEPWSAATVTWENDHA